MDNYVDKKKKMKKYRSEHENGVTMSFLFPRYKCSVCENKYLFLSSLKKNERGELICEKCLNGENKLKHKPAKRKRGKR